MTEQSYPDIDQEMLEQSVATVAYHLAQPGARLEIMYPGARPALCISSGANVLLEIANRLTAVAQTSVPRTPTRAMISATGIRDDEYYVTDPAAFVTEIWQAMWDAASGYALPSTASGSET